MRESLNLSWLRQARRRKGLTLAQAAKQIGKDGATLGRYENGDSRIATDVLLHLLSVYGISITDVIERRNA